MSNPPGYHTNQDLLLIGSPSSKKVKHNESNSNLYKDKHMKIKSPNVTNIQITLDSVETPPNARKSDAFGRNTPVASQHTANQAGEPLGS